MKYFDYNTFCERAIALFGETGQKELSSKTGISQAVISSIKTKSIKSPSADTIFLLANYFNVSTDWLLGLTDIKSTDKATKELCDTLGLSEQSIEVLQDETDTYAKKSIDWLINQHYRYSNKHIASLCGIDKEKTDILFSNFCLENSLLYCLSVIIDLAEKPTFDMQFSMVKDNNLNIDLFNETGCTDIFKIENANLPKVNNNYLNNISDTTKSQVPSESIFFPPLSFSYKEFAFHKFQQNISNILTKYTSNAIKKLQESNMEAMRTKILLERDNEIDTEDNDGND